MTENPTDFPRILLITLGAPNAKYGTGKVIRLITDCVPSGLVYWAYLKGREGDQGKTACVNKKFPIKEFHWRLKAGLWQYLYTRLQAKKIAENICEWVECFNPELIWVVPRADCIIVARHLVEALNIPVHITIHDAFEIDRVFMRHSYLYWILRKDIAVLMKNAVTIDAVSSELIDHTKREFKLNFAKTLVFPPSVKSLSSESIALVPEWKDDVRRIGVCGNPRVEEYQWNNFVGMLGMMPFSFELHVFGNDEIMMQVQYPSNVHMMALGFAETETEMLVHFRKVEISVCYLGLYREEKQEYFVRTSLSSKLTTYVSAGYPVCVDGPEDSVAWRLVSKYDAGVMVTPDEEGGSDDLLKLLTDKNSWKKKSDGALRLCRTEMDLEKNTRKLMELMSLAVDSGG